MVSIKLGLETLEDRLVPTNILFFGNSYTDAGNPATLIPALVQEIAMAAGQAAPGVAERAPGGYRLDQHAAEQTPATIRNLIGSADFVVFQGQSQEAWASYFGTATVNRFIQGAKDLADDVRGAFPNAKIIMYETWARSGSNSDVAIYPYVYANPSALQTEILQAYSAAMTSVQAKYGKNAADMAPAGEAFKNLNFNNALYADAGGHPTVRGALVAALSIYEAIYGDNTSDIPAARAASLLQSRGLNANDWIAATQAADLATGQIHLPQNQKFVEQLYQDILNRTYDVNGRNYFLNQITSGAMTRSQVADAFLKSDEYLTKYVDSQYRTILGRAADPAGMNYLLTQLRGGMNLESVRQMMFNSDEFFTKSGGTNAGFVTQLYKQFFNRAPESNFWQTALDNGNTTRARVVQAFIFSGENRANQVSLFYNSLVRRAPDAAGLSYFIGRLNTGAKLQDIVSMLAGSDEYYGRL